MRRDNVLSSVSFIIVGGSETSATVMIGIFSHLIDPVKKRILDELTAEIRSRFATEKDMTLEAMSNGDLPYLIAVLNGSLRICHPVPLGLPRMVLEGSDEYDGLDLPGGVSIKRSTRKRLADHLLQTRLGVRIFAVNRSARYFRNPDTFVPERWLLEGQKPAKHDDDRLNRQYPH